MHSQTLLQKPILATVIIAVVCLITFSCKQKETITTAPQAKPITKLIGIWAAPETAPYAKVLSLHNDNTFRVIISSDLGGYRYRGVYRQESSSIVLFPQAYDLNSGHLSSALPKSERFSIHKKEGKVQWVKSDSEGRFKMYLCDGLDNIEGWHEFIINTEDFKNRVRQYLYSKQ